MPELTPQQITRGRELAPVLRAVAQHEVWQEPDGTSVETLREVFGVSDPIADVTDEVHLAESAGLIEVRPLSAGAGGAWDLTEAGRVWLAEHDTTTKD